MSENSLFSTLDDTPFRLTRIHIRRKYGNNTNINSNAPKGSGASAQAWLVQVG